MFSEPSRFTMRIGFVGADDGDRRSGTSAVNDFGQRVADIAFKSYSPFVILRKVFAVMTAETTGRIFVTDIIGVRCPRQILGWKDQSLVGRF